MGEGNGTNEPRSQRLTDIFLHRLPLWSWQVEESAGRKRHSRQQIDFAVIRAMRVKWECPWHLLNTSSRSRYSTGTVDKSSLRGAVRGVRQSGMNTVQVASHAPTRERTVRPVKLRVVARQPRRSPDRRCRWRDEKQMDLSSVIPGDDKGEELCPVSDMSNGFTV